MPFSLEAHACLVVPILYNSGNDRVAELSRVLGATFGDRSIYPEMRETLANRDAPLQDRRKAFAILAEAGDPESDQLLVSLLDDSDFTTRVIELSPRLYRPGLEDLLIQRFPHFSGEQQAAALSAFTKREAMAVALLDAIEGKRIARQPLDGLPRPRVEPAPEP